jgi:hypothetical protein
MKPFEQYYKFGMANRDGNNHAAHMRAAAMSDKEKYYLAEAFMAYVKNKKTDEMKAVDTYLSAFLSGITYAGAYLGPGSKDETF